MHVRTLLRGLAGHSDDRPTLDPLLVAIVAADHATGPARIAIKALSLDMDRLGSLFLG